MNAGTYKFIEQTLYDFNDIDKHIEKRIEALKYPVVHTDENIGGGKRNDVSKPTERLAVTLADDLMLSNLRNIKRVVEVVLDRLEPEARKVIDLYYIEQPRKYTWVGVAEESGYSKRQCTNIRNLVFEEIAKKLGLPI